MSNPDGGVSLDILDMEDKLARIKSQTSSKLENQKHLALILSAVEENLQEQNNDKTPVAYFVSFLSLLDQSVENEEIKDLELITASVYFLDLVVPYTPKPLLISKFSDILTKLAIPLNSGNAQAPLVRSTIGTLENLLLAQDFSTWSSNGPITPRRAIRGLIDFSFDPRPKVRKRAQEAIRKILSNPPTSPSPYHPAAGLCGSRALEKLVEIIKHNKVKVNKEVNSQIIHCLQLITSITISGSWPLDQIEPLCDALLEISKTNDQYLVSSAFQAFEGLFQSMSNEINIDRFGKVIEVIFSLKPSINDTHLAAPWLAVVAKGCESFSNLDATIYIQKFPAFVDIISNYLSSDSKDIYSSSSNCLIAIISAIPDEFLLQPKDSNSEQIYDHMDKFISLLSEKIIELLTVKFQHAFKEILQFVNECILKLRTRVNPDFLDIIEVIGQWRTNESEDFSHNKEAEDILASSLSVLGPEVVLGVLPLNLTSTTNPGRAWLLPILRDNVRFSNLNYYKKEILPLVQFFEDKVSKLGKDSVHAKIFLTIIDQIWSLLPHFCDLPKDLTKAFDNEFAAQLTDLLYSKIESRNVICHALKLLAESYIAYSEGVLDDALMKEELSIKQAKSNLKFLSSKAANILSVLFNVFSSTPPDSRGFVLETIDVYLQIISTDELESTFNKVCGLLKNAMDQEAEAQTQKSKSKKDVTPDLSITMMDLIVSMTKYVPQSSHNALFTIFSSTITVDNVLMQKRSYRILSKLGEVEHGRKSIIKFASEVTSILMSSIDTVHPSARAARLASITNLIDILPSEELYFIPAILQEIIMCTKDGNERTRSLSYQILVKMGHKMNNGGIIVNSKVPGFDETTPSSEASITEFFTMVSGGLAAQSPHMISAAITAVSCLIYEFKDILPIDTMVEICSTVELFLSHNSREIAKSAIGFVKVEVLSLPEHMIKANLSELLSKLMRWSHEHKGHFKSKVKHIIERLIRKFGIDLVESSIPEEDKKLVANIKKSRNRAKRKDNEGEGTEKQSKKFVSAYEEAVYDSEVSDDEQEDVDMETNNKKSNQFIIESEDSPLDLLDRQAFAKISSSRPKTQIKKDLARKMEKKNDKLVFSEEQNPLSGTSSGIDAYLDAVKQAPIRGQKGKLKFKQKHTEEDWSDDDEPVEKTKFHPKAKSKINKPLPKRKFKAKKKF